MCMCVYVCIERDEVTSHPIERVPSLSGERTGGFICRIRIRLIDHVT